jgi:hypothetical protein
MSHVPRLDLLYRRAPRRKYVRVAVLWIVIFGICTGLLAVVVRTYLQNTIGARKALVAARQAALASARRELSELERISVTRSEEDSEQLIVTGEGTNAAGIRCRFIWRSNSHDPSGSLSIAPLAKP